MAQYGFRFQFARVFDPVTLLAATICFFPVIVTADIGSQSVSAAVLPTRELQNMFDSLTV